MALYGALRTAPGKRDIINSSPQIKKARKQPVVQHANPTSNNTFYLKKCMVSRKVFRDEDTSFSCIHWDMAPRFASKYGSASMTVMSQVA